ncbi:hypothetical protein J7T55_012727 [Diaporthe amygdali]|uniref:uncharacterized protein n=1 Tax=Phomopsis amygdali TaxID=1214568 RepID=UPI0022FF3C39|nr:uncharacterized protein J7T55_012727 [Diaporthe amygdali]KAJ0115447.1 hypothetical protein J7T55_012727 [Diaporthe amygdali]
MTGIKRLIGMSANGVVIGWGGEEISAQAVWAERSQPLCEVSDLSGFGQSHHQAGGGGDGETGADEDRRVPRLAKGRLLLLVVGSGTETAEDGSTDW